MPKAGKPNRSNRKSTIERAKIVPLLCEIDDALGTAREFGRAIELMALGFEELRDDYGTAMMTVTESLLRQIENAKDTCAKLRSEIAS